MPVYTIEEMFDLEKTIAAVLFAGLRYPWQALAGIEAEILRLGPALPTDKFDNPVENVWVAKSARVAKSAYVGGPCIIDEGAEVRHCAFIRGNAIVGKGAVVGNSTELKNSVLFDGVQVPHFNYIGDSVLGYKAHLGAGAVTSNVKSDKTPVVMKAADEQLETGRKKVGAMVGDHAEVGCNSVLCPGSVLGRGCNVYPVSRVRGQVPANSIYKAAGEIVPKHD